MYYKFVHQVGHRLRLNQSHSSNSINSTTPCTVHQKVSRLRYSGSTLLFHCPLPQDFTDTMQLIKVTHNSKSPFFKVRWIDHRVNWQLFNR